jgi:hypothetical protein
MHLLRGATGIAALALAVHFQRHVWPVILGMPLAIWMFRGCLVCWTTGLIETVAMRILARADRTRPVARWRQTDHVETR